MISFYIAFIIGLLIGAFIPAVEGYYMAKYHRNRNPWLWFVNCYLTGLFALMILICSPTLEKDDELGFEEIDTLGRFVIIVSLILTIIVCGFIWVVINVPYSYFF